MEEIIVETNVSANIIIDNNGSNVDITPMTDIFELNIQLKNNGIKVGDVADPDNSTIVKKIYATIFQFYDEDYCRGETLNTYNSTFGKDNNYRLLNMFAKENVSDYNKNRLLTKAMEFKHIYCSIGNFTVLDLGRPKSINTERGSFYNSLKDSWPLTLLCIQDFLNGYSDFKNPLRNVFETSKTTIAYFNHYKGIENGFEQFCDDQYLSPKYHNNEPWFAYVDELSNGKYKVKLDLFDGLCFSKPLAETVIEAEQYIDRTQDKIIKRGEILLKEYIKRINK
jgi:hypothetical protein